ncbi:transmembrane 9 superfamily member 10-like isoform X2 [Primulina eburnea]|uniref:transmembrane 9 superfamily member 10-like isoform X2 n=1 Tax=Primulina eburnea TaxID=1245227 RepID=UPI003C6BDCB0
MDVEDRLPFRIKVCIWASTCVGVMFGLFIAHDLYLFGATDFVEGDPMQVKVQKLASVKTQLSYFYYSLPYCMPKEIVDHHLSLGEIVQKDLIENSPYQFKMLELQMCRVVCRTTLNDNDAKVLKEAIDGEYRVNMILDDLPLVMLYNRSDMDSFVYQQGFPVGVKMLYAGKMEPKYFINNHLTFIVKYHKDEKTDDARIVGFEVKPFSVKHEYEGKWNDKIRLTNCDPHTTYNATGKDSPLEIEDEKEIIFTYDVEFQESEIRWVSRWETYVCTVDSHIHWFSVFHSFTVFIWLAIPMVSNVVPMMDNDISPYTKLKTQEEAAEVTEEETGWTIVRGDVFRPPKNSDLLCVFAGTGVQCFGMILVTMVSAALGFITPSSRKGLMESLLFVWVFMGMFAGYTSTILSKMFNGTQWKKMALKTSFPGIVFIIFFIVSAPSWGEESWGAVPFETMFALVLLWSGIFVSLVCVGSYVGFSKPAISNPVKTNRIPREIPKQAWFMNPVFSILIGGIFPFGVVSVELFFIVTSVWTRQFYCILGFLLPVLVFLILICAQISMLLCYYQLCREDYLWWWRSFLTSVIRVHVIIFNGHGQTTIRNLFWRQDFTYSRKHNLDPSVLEFLPAAMLNAPLKI